MMGNSLDIGPLTSPREGRLSLGLPRLQAGILFLLLVWLYHVIVYRLALQWITDPNFSHGFFVPAFAIYVIWQDRKKLKSIVSAPSWAGLPVIVFALLMLVLGVLGVELFTSRLSILVLLAGLIILFRGWRCFRALMFPWAFLFLMIPLPNLILQRFTFPLQILASKLSTFLLELAGVPVLREGNIIHLARMSLEVVEACSGIRSLLSLLTLAIIYGYLLEKRNWVRVALACSAVPIAVAANGFRIFGTGLLVQYWDPDKAEGFFHAFQGWLIFVVSLVLLFTFHGLINLIWKPGAEQKLDRSPQSQQQEPKSFPTQTTGATQTANGTLRFTIAALLILATAVGLQAHSQSEVFPPRQPLSSLPAQIDNWTGTDESIDQETLDILGKGEFLQRDFADISEQQPDIDLFIAYYPSQKAGDTIHSVLHCIWGSGYVPERRELIELAFPSGTFPVNRVVITKGVDRQLVLYWFQAHGRAVASEYRLKYYLVADSIRLHRSDGALSRLMTPMYPGESADAAQARMMKLGSRLIPLLDNYIPR